MRFHVKFRPKKNLEKVGGSKKFYGHKIFDGQKVGPYISVTPVFFLFFLEKKYGKYQKWTKINVQKWKIEKTFTQKNEKKRKNL